MAIYHGFSPKKWWFSNFPSFFVSFPGPWLAILSDRFRENHDHLLFVSYPCGFAKFASRNFEKWPETLESGHLVQCFNIVHLESDLDGNLNLNLPIFTRDFWESLNIVHLESESWLFTGAFYAGNGWEWSSSSLVIISLRLAPVIHGAGIWIPTFALVQNHPVCR
jgi:hypothetical protein